MHLMGLVTSKRKERIQWIRYKEPEECELEAYEQLTDNLPRWSFRHRCLPNEKVVTLLEREFDSNLISPGYLKKSNTCLGSSYRSTILLNTIFQDVNDEIMREKEHEEQRRQTIDLSRKAIEQSKGVIRAFKKPQRIQNKPKLLETYLETVRFLTGFVQDFKAVISLEPTFACETKNACKELEMFAKLDISIFIDLTSFKQGIIVEERINTDTLINKNLVDNSCVNATVCGQTSRRVEIMGSYSKTEERKDTDFVLIIINDGCIGGPRELCGVYRRKMSSTEKFLTWKIVSVEDVGS